MLAIGLFAGLEICILNSVDEEELVEVWTAFSVSRLGGASPTLETLGQMERKEFGKCKEQPQIVQKSRSQENTLIIYNTKEPSVLYPFI